MEKKAIRSIIILLAVLIQISVLSVIFPPYQVPNLILILVIAWTIRVGFIGMLPWIIILGIVADIAMFDSVGVNPILLVLSSYFVSFFSRRFLIENKVWGAITIVFFIIITTVFYYSSSLALSYSGDIFLKNFFHNSLFFWKNSAFQIIFNTLLFLIIYFPIKKIENFINFYDQRVELK